MNRRTAVAAPAAWDALDAILPRLPAEPVPARSSALDAVTRCHVDQIDDVDLRGIVERHLAQRRASDRAVTVFGLDGVDLRKFEEADQ